MTFDLKQREKQNWQRILSKIIADTRQWQRNWKHRESGFPLDLSSLLRSLGVEPIIRSTTIQQLHTSYKHNTAQLPTPWQARSWPAPYQKFSSTFALFSNSKINLLMGLIFLLMQRVMTWFVGFPFSHTFWFRFIITDPINSFESLHTQSQQSGNFSENKNGESDSVLWVEHWGQDPVPRFGHVAGWARRRCRRRHHRH